MFSVIIPIHNKASYLARSIQSVLHQSFINFEMLLIDDASTDNSLEIANSFSDPRIKIIRRSEAGPGGYAARNEGIRKASYKYVAFLDADDEWNTDFLLNIHKLILQFPEANVFATAWQENNQKQQKTNAYYNAFFKKNAHLVPDFFTISAQGLNPLCTIVAVTSKQKMYEIGGFPDGKSKRGGDIETWMRLMIGNQLAWTPYIGAIYYKNVEASVTKTIKDIETPYVFFSAKQLLTSSPTETHVSLKKYANYYTRMSIIRGIVAGQNKKLLLQNFFKEEDPFFYLFAKILSLFSPNILNPFFRIYRKFKIKFSNSDIG